MGMPENIARQHANAKALNGIAVEYARGSAVLEITVVPGRTLANMSSDQDGGLSIKTRVSDFLILAEDLAFGSEGPSAPLRGDLITTTNGDSYEVLPQYGEPEYRKSDPYGVVLRVHVKLIDQAE